MTTTSPFPRCAAVLLGLAAAACDSGSSTSGDVQEFIGDFVWQDRNGDGLQDANEPGLEGILVTLLNTNGFEVAKTKSDERGEYRFDDLDQSNYVVWVRPADLPAGLHPSPCDVGSNKAIDSNCQPASVSLLVGDDTIDFGYEASGRIGDQVWKDVNGNGLQDPGEPGLAGVQLVLAEEGGEDLRTVTSNIDGSYQFSGLFKGTYVLRVESTPPGLAPTLCNVGGDDTIDNDCSPVTVVLTGHDTVDRTVDFGFAGTGSIGDLVWTDGDCDGVQDPGETGPDGVRVVLRDPFGNDRETFTSGGAYGFTGLCAGDYTVTVDESTLPPDSFPAPCMVGGPALDSNCSPARVTLPANDTVDDTIDFGYCVQGSASIGDTVWDDLDGDGLQDPGEPGLAGVVVRLEDGAGGALATDTTGLDGRYRFDFLPAGTYVVDVDTPPGFAPSPCEVGPPDADSNCLPAAVNLGSGEYDDTIDFGYTASGTGSLIAGTWNDLDRDGIRDGGERGIAGALVSLFDGAGQLLGSTLTDDRGACRFSHLPAGTYVISVDMARTGRGWLASPGGAGRKDGATVVLPFAPPAEVRVDLGYHLSGPREGCSVVYWRDHPAAWPSVYSPGTPFAHVFADAFTGRTLLEVLQQTGEGPHALGREAVAALLNATAGGVSYPLPAAEVVARFDAAREGIEEDRETLRDDLAAQNALRCPRE